VAKVRVLVANQPRLMRELVLDAIAGHQDIEVVGEVAEEGSILEKVNEVHPDFLILTLHNAEEQSSLCDELWERFPRLKVLALQAESNVSILYWVNLSIQASRIETSEKGILDALRGGTIPRQQPESELSPKVN
jgi:chemotaxis response regulator CheB